ncbi:hypothetical protein Dsin_009110 [Dipteronia sinensis]|uniref:RNase H type-1 domain-containing protein n=1 Tax=Dipteronia sinensis TaxID=43782 RepID=A0AAE0ED68_9ROSI|nr:hypothetical protein Dsin_009110 [Dipteronia sinensis]
MIAGLRINFHKSCVVKVGKRRTSEEAWETVLNCQKATLPITYRGFPLGARSSAKAFWVPVINRIKQRLAPWNRNVLNKGGRLTLIKAVISSIPSYYMSVFKMPVGVAEVIEKLQREFFLSLMARGSKTENVIKEGLKVIIGDDKRADFWSIRWGEDFQLKWTCLRIFALAVNKTGVVQDYDQWKVFMDFLKNIIIRHSTPDVLSWTFSVNGRFSVGSFSHKLAVFRKDNEVDFTFSWKGLCPIKIELFMWFLNLPESCLETKILRKAKVDKWIPLSADALKFNVDGSSQGNPGSAGIGRVLRDFPGKILVFFSINVGHQDAISAEIMAIHKAVSLCSQTTILFIKEIEVISDLKVVVSWVNEEGIGNHDYIELAGSGVLGSPVPSLVVSCFASWRP